MAITNNSYLFVIKQIIQILVEVRIDLLSGIKQFVFFLSLTVCLVTTDISLVGQQGVAAEGEKLIDTGGKLLHSESILTLYEVFDVVEVASHSSL